MNFSDLPNGYPKLVFSNISDDDFKSIADATGSLMTAGAIHADAEIENRLRNMLSLPEMSEEMAENYEDLTKPVADPTKSEDALPSDKKKPATENKNVDEAKKQKVEEDAKTQSSLINEAVALNERIVASLLEDN